VPCPRVELPLPRPEAVILHLGLEPVIVHFLDGDDVATDLGKNLKIFSVLFTPIPDDLSKGVIFASEFHDFTTHQGTHRSWNDFTSRSL